MSHSDRRTFLKESVAGVATAAVAASASAAANEKIVVGLIGCGGRGGHMANVFRDITGVEIAYVCDPDAPRRAAAAERYNLAADRAVSDMRRVFDDKSVDAVIIAACNHWHGPATILACNAGKHVYVEKPCCHNLREGRLMVEAARRNNRLVQVGTQSRSTTTTIQSVEQLHRGLIGTVLAAKAWNIQKRGSIGRGQPGDPPKTLDYDLWLGPAPHVPFQSNRVFGGWGWFYHTGLGDFGADGIHDIDYARWGLGVNTHPTFISGAGGIYRLDDEREFPDTQQVTFEYATDGPAENRRMLIYEQRLWTTNYPYNVDSGVEFYGTNGQMFLSRRGKVQVVDGQNKRVELKIELRAQDERAHAANFCEAVRGPGKLNADIEVAHLSTALCHLGNIATRVRRALKFDPKTESIQADPEANELLTRRYREGHWAVPRA
ncbi:MAG: Gfo/Idh/MocA family oxidoreductase [Pirellulales bacterium]